jgi:hypothetical protein
MGTATLPRVARITVASLGLLLSISVAWSADPAPSTASSQAAPSKEIREKMATLHEQMAICLRSDKSVAECRTEMMKSCRETMGAQSCPMMGMGPGMGHGGMKQTLPPTTSSQ